MSLKRDHRGNMILRFRSGGRGSKYEYHNMGALTWGAAKDREAEIRAEAKRRRGLADPGTTFESLSRTWMEAGSAKHEESTKTMNEVMLRRHILPVLGSTRVEALRPMAIEQYRMGRLAEKRPPAMSSLNLELGLILAILNFGEKHGIVRNPITRGTVEKLPVEQKTVYFEPDEWHAFIEAADSDEELRQAAPLWRLKLLTASRISEMVGLRWNDVDLERGFIAIRQPKTQKKGVKIKALVLTDEMRAVLATVPRGIGEAYVFTDAGLPWTTERLRRHFARTLRLAGLVGAWTPHSIRHTAATWARKTGIPLDRVAKMLGHAGLGLVLRYAHFSPEDLNPALDAVAAMERRGPGARPVHVEGHFGQAGIDAGVSFPQ
jgi:integrase